VFYYHSSASKLVGCKETFVAIHKQILASQALHIPVPYPDIPVISAKEEKTMYRLFGVLIFAVVFCFASSLSYGQEPANDSASGRGPDAVAQPQEHFRHIRAHKRPKIASDTDQKKETPSSTLAVAKQIDGGSAKARKVSSPQAKPTKTKLQAKVVKPKVAVEKAAVSRPATPPEIRSPKSSGFFEELFNQD
jgi:hypothetical protein